MDEVKDRGGGRLVIHRSFVQSRYEVEFVAMAYEIILPMIPRELAKDMETTRGNTDGAAAWKWWERSCV